MTANTLSKSVILLDTPIVAGVFAVAKSGPHVSQDKKLFMFAIRQLSSLVGENFLVRVPTPVCYELMSMNNVWYQFIDKSTNPVFSWAHSQIENEILLIAARYSFSANCNSYDGDRQKMKTMDPLIAAFCIKNDHYLLTTNQQDFPESHFSYVGSQVLVRSGRAGSYRSVLYLLKPIG